MLLRPIALLLALHMALTTLCWRPLKTDSAPEAELYEAFPGADPWYYQYDGVYYYCYGTGNGVGVRTSDSIETLHAAEHRQVYTAPAGTAYSCNWWAPELHRINGAWYIYVAADDGDNENHRMYVLKSDSPLGPFEMLGKISSPDDRWAIDGTVLELEGELYFIWSGWENDTDGAQNLYLAHMSDPATIDSERVMISAPEKKWEKNGMPINEGPEILETENAVYLVYSASGSWTDDYCLGMLRLIGADPMKPGAWAKCPVPVLQKAPGAYGPGHCSFVESQDGKTRYVVYHANAESGTGWGGRSVRIREYRVICGVPVFFFRACA